MKFQTCIAKRVFTYVRAPSTVMRKQILSGISASGALIHHVYHNKLPFSLGQHTSGCFAASVRVSDL